MNVIPTTTTTTCTITVALRVFILLLLPIIQTTMASSPSSNQSESRNMYNKQATNWVRTEPRCLSDFTGRPVVFSMLEPHIKDATVIDVGCGEGYCARKMVEMGAKKVIGSDISAGMIESAIATSKGDDRFTYFTSSCSNLVQGLKEHHSSGIVDHEGSMYEQNEGEGSMDLVDVATAVFLFNYLKIEEMEDCMEQTYKVLKPGGIFVFSVPHPSMIYCNHEDSIFRLESEGKGYFSSRNEKILGHISTIDGNKLNIMSVHKTINDYIKAINKVGFSIVDIQEAGVKEEHLKINKAFFESVKDRPLHLIFKLKKETP